eukprot:8432024-Lingulodinium_polyedra.AAC.1
MPSFFPAELNEVHESMKIHIRRWRTPGRRSSANVYFGGSPHMHDPCRCRACSPACTCQQGAWKEDY